MAWNPLTEPCDYIQLGNRISPGLATVEGANSPRHWDQRQGYGFSGAFAVFKGTGLSQFKVTFRLYTPDHWDSWEKFSQLLKKVPPVTRPGALRVPRPGPLDIWHPFLEQLGIVAVEVVDVKQPVQTAPGEWSIVVEFLEFRRPRLALSAPDSSTANEDNDPVARQIRNQTQDIQALASQ